MEWEWECKSARTQLPLWEGSTKLSSLAGLQRAEVKEVFHISESDCVLMLLPGPVKKMFTLIRVSCLRWGK